MQVMRVGMVKNLSAFGGEESLSDSVFSIKIKDIISGIHRARRPFGLPVDAL